MELNGTMMIKNGTILNKVIVPKAKRNIFINDKRFYLNIPELTFFYRYEFRDDLYLWIMKDNTPHYVPLPNINYEGYVCFGENPNCFSNITDSISYVFNSYFNCTNVFPHYNNVDNNVDNNEYYDSLQEYIVKYNPEEIFSNIKTIYKVNYKETWIKTNNILNQKTLQFYFDNPIKVKANVEHLFSKEKKYA